MSNTPKYSIGQVIHHKLFNYYGVIVGVDETFSGTEEWYETVAKSKPPKDRPWYNVLVDGAFHTTYVAEQNLEKANPPKEITHPLLDNFFDRFEDGKYGRDLH